MLKTRLQTAGILLLIILSTLFGLPKPSFSILTVCFILAGSFEWAYLSGCQTHITRLLYTFITAIILLFSCLSNHQSVFLGAGLAWWGFAAILLASYPACLVVWKKSIIQLIMGWFVLIPAGTAIFYIEQQLHHQLLLLYFLGVVALTDIGGFVFGNLLGKRKLAPNISPKKTWEGVFGSLILVILYSILISLFYHYTYWHMILLIIYSSLISVFAILGDLIESMFKRAKGIKDSGTLIPGHGGVLDRIDSLSAAAPMFWALFPLMPFLSN
ncbi:MAG: phosphatidate cytidylyltransferase [Endozoicomonadaceae bacterium]|nr:phosphatidate cytidylyltransferase [Endozoicomonadaceae bacterium]MBE8233080.1 phosphatidate cytidylyltransferase [Endozoicomonadaceae bacterium]